MYFKLHETYCRTPGRQILWIMSISFVTLPLTSTRSIKDVGVFFDSQSCWFHVFWMTKGIRPCSLESLKIFFFGLFMCAILYASQVQVWVCLTSLDFYHVYRCKQAWAYSAKVCVRLFLSIFPHASYSYIFALEKLSLHSLCRRRHRLDALFCSGLSWS
jgi:hypothetical protein